MHFCEQIADLRERTDYPTGKRTEDISRERGIESQLRSAPMRAHRDQEDATDPMVTPQDYEVRQSGRVQELQNSDLWLRRTDLSCHFPIHMTIRDVPFKNYEQERTMEGYYEIQLLEIDDMEQDLKELDADVASPTQRAASGDDALWVPSPGSRGSQKQRLVRFEPVSFSQCKKLA